MFFKLRAWHTGAACYNLKSCNEPSKKITTNHQKYIPPNLTKFPTQFFLNHFSKTFIPVLPSRRERETMKRETISLMDFSLKYLPFANFIAKIYSYMKTLLCSTQMTLIQVFTSESLWSIDFISFEAYLPLLLDLSLVESRPSVHDFSCSTQTGEGHLSLNGEEVWLPAQQRLLPWPLTGLLVLRLVFCLLAILSPEMSRGKWIYVW